ncbi:MAG: nitric oxide synthase [Chloroflexi bacterium RBG_19FT_COMBO_50_10]|nr:MAG: nitric oxide synthase [Chloroflexi bacterium RBG_19FT_COMBO_50_10]
MKSIVIYDSLYGNTERIAQAMGNALVEQGEVVVTRVGEAKIDQLVGADLLVVGSPTQQFRPTVGTKNLLNLIPKNGLKGIKVAAFDTRFPMPVIEKTPPLPFFVRIFGYAAGRIAKLLKAKGGELVVAPEGFFVEDTKGPLIEGELERAASWAKKLFA